jgi:hypothetical protein
MADPTYESEMNQPVHKPGMESVVNRGAAADDPKDSSGNRSGPRRAVSPPTRSAFGADSASDPAPKAPPQAPAPTPDASGIGGRMREQQIMDTVDAAQK